MSTSLDISLFGTCVVRLRTTETLEIRGAKHRALIAILATAPMGRRTRTFLQNTLWGYSGYDSGHQNLRRALADLRKLMGDAFDVLFHTTNTDVELDFEHVRFVGDINAGPFLEDLNVAEKEYLNWVETIRDNPSQIEALYRTTLPGTFRPRPFITMLPLKQLGDDPVLAALGDWIGEQACRVLSRSRFLNVISHLSGRAMAQKTTLVTEVRQTLSVDYLTTGFLRRSGTEIICDIDFIEADSGQIIWNRTLHISDLVQLDDAAAEIEHIARSIAKSIADSAINSSRSNPMKEIADQNLLISGVGLMHRVTMRDFLKSRDYLREATARLPNFAETHAWLGKWYVLNVMKGYSMDQKRDTQLAIDCTARALDIDPESSLSLTIDGFASNNLAHDFDLAGKRFDAALEVNPNESLAWLLRGSLKAFMDDGETAVSSNMQARKLSPIDPFSYYYDSLASTAYIAADDFENALAFAERSLTANDRHLSTHRAKITALHFLDRHEEACAAAQDLLAIWPSYNLQHYERSHPVSKQKLGRRAISAMAASGIKH